MPIKDCYGCPSATINTGYAMGEGPTTAPIMFIGEALGEQEAIEGRPFVGGTGKMLRMMIHQAGIPEGLYYITNVVKCRPPNNRTPNPSEIENCSYRYLHKELAYVKPLVIVPVGDTALRAIIPDTRVGITSGRGYTFNSKWGTVIPIVHPSFVARGNPHFWGITVADLAKVKAAGLGKPMIPAPERFVIRPNIYQVQEAVEHIKRGRLRFSFDLETIGQQHQLNIMCIGLAWSASDAICIPFLRKGGYEYWKNPAHEVEAWRLLCSLFDSDIDVVGQNIFTFDIPKLVEVGVHFRRTNSLGNSRAHDTLIRHHNLACELPHSLEFLTSIYTNMAHYKGVKVTIWADDETLWIYNARDCVATWVADQEISMEMREAGLA